MKSKTWMILDCNNLCWRAYHTTGHLSFGDIPTGITYGFLKEVTTLQDSFGTSGMIFCFDYGKGHRKTLQPTYKAKRYADQEGISIVNKQIDRLRKRYLRQLGYRNIFYAWGYEADDIIASVCKRTIPEGDRGIIVSSDKDLFQLLKKDRIAIWRPTTKELYTKSSLMEEYGVTPRQWVDTKAIAGCGTDEVKGIEGIGEVTAAKFLNGSLREGKRRQSILDNLLVWKNNLELVRLPLKGTPTFKLRKDFVTLEKWDKLINKLGMNSLRVRIPVME